MNRKKLPNIPSSLIHQFLRGLFDGDGSVSISNINRKNKEYPRHNYAFNLMAEKELLLEI